MKEPTGLGGNTNQIEVLANARARSGMDPARRRRNRRSGRSEARRRRWAWENLVIGELWAQWWAAQWRWDTLAALPLYMSI